MLGGQSQALAVTTRVNQTSPWCNDVFAAIYGHGEIDRDQTGASREEKLAETTLTSALGAFAFRSMVIKSLKVQQPWTKENTHVETNAAIASRVKRPETNVPPQSIGAQTT